MSIVFGRDNLSDYIQKEIQNGNLLRIKNKSTQASELKALIASSYSKNAFNDINISHNDTSVNTIILNNKENNTKYSARDTEVLDSLLIQIRYQ